MQLEHTAPSRRFRWSPIAFLLVFAAGLSVYQLVLLFGACTGHDQAWYLFDAERYLDGAKLYGSDLIETNPPLPIWFSVLPVSLARATHMTPTTGLHIVVLMMIALSTAWCVRLLWMRQERSGSTFLVPVACAVFFLEFDSTWSNFGQREHLLVILFLPYILAAATGVVRRLPAWERSALGVAAGVAICFKPQHAIDILALEVLLAVHFRTLRRAWSAEALSIVATCALYLVLSKTLTPLYFTTTFPLVVQAYWAFGTQTFGDLLRSDVRVCVLMLAVAGATFALRRRLHEPMVPAALIVCSFGAYTAYASQHKGWSYQRFPCETFLLLAGFWLLFDLLYPALQKVVDEPVVNLRFAVATLLLLTAPLCAATLNRRITYRPQGCGPLYEFFGQYAPGTTVAIFSPTLVNFQAVYEHRLNWASRFAGLWPIPAILQNERNPQSPLVLKQHMPPQQVAKLAATLRTDTVEDMNLWKPAVVLVEHCTLAHPCQAIEGITFDIIPWFQQDPAFAEVWSHYKRQPEAPENYDLYTRVR